MHISHFWNTPVPIFSDVRFSYLALVQDKKKSRAFYWQMHDVQFMPRVRFQSFADSASFVSEPDWNLTLGCRRFPCLALFPVLDSIYLVRDSSAVQRLFVRLAGAVGRQSTLHQENSGFAAPTLGRHIFTFRGYRILFSIQNPYINRFTNHFSIHS